jgi:NitT/TauT family transport system permease protein
MAIVKEKRAGQYHKHLSFRYPVTLGQRLYSILWGPLIVVLVLAFAAQFLSTTQYAAFGSVSIATYFLALFSTLARMAVAFFFALILSVPLALLATRTSRCEFVFLPLFDILESIPILAFLPVFILFFIKLDYLNGAAIVILFLAMLWNIVFTVVGGLKVIPSEIKSAARIFGLRGFSFFRKVTLPAIVPQLVTGSILAFAQGWNITIVAEVLHVYAPHGNPSQDLFGIGSILVQAASSGQTDIFITAIVVMILGIAFLNFFVWQKLLHYAQRFRFE